MKRSKTTPDTIGQRLRAAREKLGLSVDEVAKRTKMSARVVEALEEDRAIDRLSPVYVRSFLRMYARLVGLNEQALVRELGEQQEEAEEHPLPAAPAAPVVRPRAAEPAPRVTTSASRTVPWPAWRPRREQVILIGGVAVVLLILFGVAKALAHRAPSPARTAQKPAAVKVKVAAKPAPKPAARPAPKPAPAKKPEPAPVQRIMAEPSAAVPSTEAIKLQVKAKERTWLRVMADGKVIFQSVLDKGVVETWNAQDKISLWLGSAGSVELTLNGKSLGTPGRRNETIKDLQITRQGIVKR